MTIRVILIRNAEHLGEAKPFWAGPEVGLSPRGKRQAGLVCERLLAEKLVAIYSSDYARAIETVQPLAEALGLEVIPLPAFRAFEQGEFMGKTLQETASILGEDVWNEIVTNPDPDKRYFAGGETLHEESERAWCGLAELVRKHSPDDCIVISTHMTIIGTLLCRMVDLPLQKVWFWGGSMRAEHPSITEVGLSDGVWSLKHYGCGEHLR